MRGTLVSGSADVLLSYAGEVQIDQWIASCKMVDGSYPEWNVSGVELNLEANPDSFDLNGKGIFTCPNGLHVHVKAPKIRVAGETAQFDVRLEDDNCYLLRAAGSKQGRVIQLDPEKSHLFGSKVGSGDLIWDKGRLMNGHLDSILNWPVVSLFLEKAGVLPDVKVPFEEFKVEGDFNYREGIKVALTGGGWQAKAQYSHKLWNVMASNEEIEASCNLFTVSDAFFQLKNGKMTYKDALSVEFEGKILEDFSADLLLSNIVGDLASLNIDGLKGPLTGHGCMTMNERGIETDLDVDSTTVFWNGIQVESLNPIHLYCSSAHGVLVKGLDLRATKNGLEARGKIGLVEYNKNRSRFAVQKGEFHLASDFLTDFSPQIEKVIDRGLELDFNGTLEFASDFSEFNCEIDRGLIPLAGEMRQIENLRFSLKPRLIEGVVAVYHQDQWAEIALTMHREASNLKGVLKVKELGLENPETPLAISWNYDPSGLAIHTITGNFAGLDASFQAASTGQTSELVGHLGIDFHRLCQWIDPMVAVGIRDLGMGSGYELKGSLSLDRNDFSKFAFKGILGGKQIQFFDYQFRTLMSAIEFNAEKIQLNDICISDSSVTANIGQVLIEAKDRSPWTIQIPLISIEDLRPSLLRKPGEGEPTLSPLIVREFILRDFQGILDDGKTYTATGSLSFVNTFKREETFFDLPSNFFGRIIGLDFDLLIPVIGDLTFDLKNGFFELKELKNAFSEGQRSEFFLVESDAPQRVDLRGNLQILVKMKQFVIFALTQGFMISIDGNLSDPHFSLQKRLKFDRK